MNKQLFQWLTACALVIVIHFKVNGQAIYRTPVNYVGMLAGVEWNTISGMNGVEYERMIIGRNHLTAGIKTSYIFPYKTGNMQQLNSICCNMSEIATLLITSDLYTAGRYPASGFFVHAGLGVAGKKYDWERSDRIIEVRPAFEAGAGWLFILNRQFAIKWTNTVTFPSKDGGVTITRIAFGF